MRRSAPVPPRDDGLPKRSFPIYYGMSPDFPLELQVTVTLAEKAGATRMTLHHVGIPQGEMSEMCAQGGNESFDKLAESLR